ncbi:hypothetical protein [Nitratidesulfovibrio sp.]
MMQALATKWLHRIGNVASLIAARVPGRYGPEQYKNGAINE